jgi:AcrR family transcriptional regulator
MNTTRERLLDVSAGLFQRQGIAGTGIKQIVTEAHAQFSSLYHHFPGGKEQLAAEAILRSGRTFGLLIPTYFDPAPDVVAAVTGFFDGAAQHLLDTDFADACPIATVALEISSSNEQLRQACATVFGEWISAVEERLVPLVDDVAGAHELAVAAVVALEGAFVLARVLRSTQPLTVARDLLMAKMAEVLEPRRPDEGRPPIVSSGC